MKIPQIVSRVALAALLLSILNSPLSTAFAQGSLTPPGTPAPTMKTFDEIEPRINIQRAINPLPTDASNQFIINTPGSYYLTANLAVAKTNGIHVIAPNAARTSARSSFPAQLPIQPQTSRT